ncbi:MAG: hypothetical protein E7641_04785, partial [Ruminococcaceae bacterium]|nr:hypothetical protein [Oscillospiraceae bacterium]
RLRINSESNEWEVSYDDGEHWTSLGVKATGADGQDGANGSNGTNGTNGTNGVDGKTPRLRINSESNEWEVSYDDGEHWTSLGVKATGADGQDGANGSNGINGTNGDDGATIASIVFNEEGKLIITMTDGTEFIVDMPEKEEHVHSYSELIDYSNDASLSCTERMYYQFCASCSEIRWCLGKHNFSEGYYSDGTHHWFDCYNCDEKLGFEEHTYNFYGFCTCESDMGPSDSVIYGVSEDGSHAVVTGYTGSDAKVVIASQYGDLQVLEIAERAFENTDVETVIISGSIMYIGEYAFADCSNLSRVSTMEGVVLIDNYAFANCSSLKYIDIKNVDAINAYAFSGCSALDGVTLSEDMEFITGGLFENCSSLTNITIPSSVTLIGNDAFSGCSSLRCVELSNNLKSIGGSAFSGCTSLGNITLPDSIESIGENAFESCLGLTSIVLPQNITDICYGLFNACQNLKTVTIEGAITTIGIRAFEGCIKLESITIPASVESIGLEAFESCWALEQVVFDENSKLTTIGDSVFEDCKKLASITIPSTLESISAHAFEDCENLEEVVLDENSQVTSIGDSAFANCSKLTNIAIGEEVERIGNSAFLNCTSLEDIVISNNVVHIGELAFNNTAYYNNESNWENGALYSTGNHLLAVKTGTVGIYTVNEDTKIIADSVFKYCDYLTGIVISGSVTNIGENAFYYCSALDAVYYCGTSEEWLALLENIENGNTDFTSATLYYYSETEPEEEGNYWHYVDGVATVWEVSAS